MAAWDGWYISYVFTHLARRVWFYEISELDPIGWFTVEINMDTNEVFVGRTVVGSRPKYLVRAKDELDAYLQLSKATIGDSEAIENLLYII